MKLLLGLFLAAFVPAIIQAHHLGHHHSGHHHSGHHHSGHQHAEQDCKTGSLHTDYVASLKSIDDCGKETCLGTISGTNAYHHTGSWSEFTQKCKDVVGGFMHMISHSTAACSSCPSAVDLDLKTRLVNHNSNPSSPCSSGCKKWTAQTPMLLHAEVQPQEVAYVQPTCEGTHYCQPEQPQYAVYQVSDQCYPTYYTEPCHTCTPIQLGYRGTCSGHNHHHHHHHKKHHHKKHKDFYDDDCDDYEDEEECDDDCKKEHKHKHHHHHHHKKQKQYKDYCDDDCYDYEEPECGDDCAKEHKHKEHKHKEHKHKHKEHKHKHHHHHHHHKKDDYEETPVVIAPVVPVAPAAPVATVTTVEPVAPVAPVAAVAPVAPVTPVVVE